MLQTFGRRGDQLDLSTRDSSLLVVRNGLTVGMPGGIRSVQVGDEEALDPVPRVLPRLGLGADTRDAQKRPQEPGAGLGAVEEGVAGGGILLDVVHHSGFVRAGRWRP